MRAAGNFLHRAVLSFLEVAAAIILMVLMSLTCADVIGRYFFNRPIWGGFEMTEALLALLIFIGLPLVTLRGDHIDIDMLPIPRRLQRINHVAVNLIGMVATGYLSYRLWLRGEQLLSAGEVTLQTGLRLGYVALAMAVLTGVTAAAFLLVACTAPAPKRTLVSDV